jgi:hypothetical protein
MRNQFFSKKGNAKICLLQMQTVFTLKFEMQGQALGTEGFCPALQKQKMKGSQTPLGHVF